MEIGAAKCSCAICFVDSMETTPIRTGKIRAINTSTEYLGKVRSGWKWFIYGRTERSLRITESRSADISVASWRSFRLRFAQSSSRPVACSPRLFPRGNAEFLSPRNFRASIASPIEKLQRDTPRRANCCSDWWIAYLASGWRNDLEREERSFSGRCDISNRLVVSARILSRIVAVINVALFGIDIYQRIPGYRWKRCG